MAEATANPYVGPRTFEERDRHLFFGREREARELLWMVMSEPLVLFYAPSGAGKSSLINTRLVPGLRQEGFQVLPIGRVGGELPDGITQVGNVFVFNLLLSLDQGGWGSTGHISHFGLSDFLSGRAIEGQTDAQSDLRAEGQQGRVLIIDQFEELFTTHLERWGERRGFFRQLGQAMRRAPMLWVVLVIRQDYVAALDPYARLLPGKLRTRFHMRRMGCPAALEAVTKPAAGHGRPFAPGVAESLVDNLRQIRVQEQAQPCLGEFIEPVQLQVACYQLWENLKTRPAGEISHQDLQQLGDVDAALAQFYEAAIARVLTKTGGSEIELREWFAQQLITEAGTRGTVYQGLEQTGGLANETVQLLADQFLLRAEVRAGGTWYELVHDRFVEPILSANEGWRWRQARVVQAALAWEASGRGEDELYQGQQLQAALTRLRGQQLEPLVAEFLDASQKLDQAREERRAQRRRAQELEQARRLAEEAAARERAEAAARQEAEARAAEQAQASRRLRRLALGLAAVFLVALAAASLAWRQGQIAQTRAAEAEAAKATAEISSTEAVAQKAIAEKAQKEAEETAQVLQANDASSTKQALVDQEATLQTQLTAAAATPELPTATPIPPTATPGAHPTTTPSPIPTLTPDVPALETQVAQVQATQQAVATGCTFEPEGEFRVLWEELQDELGCPLQIIPITSWAAGQPFEGGWMFWREDTARIYAVYKDTESDDTGSWAAYADTWSEGDAEFSCPDEDTPSQSPPTPKRGFGKIWCDNANVRQRLGPATEAERGFEAVVQDFAKGFVLRTDEGTQIFYDDDSWESIERIVFVSDRDGNSEIYIMARDGSQQRRLSNHPAEDDFPAVSPDGNLIAFQSLRDGNWDIYIMNIDGTGLQRVTNDDSIDRLPAWSPDSRWLVFNSARDGEVDLYVIRPDGTGLRQLTDDNRRDGHASWSTQDLIVFNSGQDDPNTWEIVVMKADGSDRLQLTRNTVNDWSPSWSPDGRTIIFLSTRDGNPEIYLMGADGGSPRRLHASSGYEWGAGFSHNGKWIAFTSDQTGDHEIYIMKANGNEVRRLTDAGGWYPSWVP